MTPTWRKSSHSGTNNECVELARVDEVVLVRNSNRPEAGTLAIAPTQLGAWLDHFR